MLDLNYFAFAQRTYLNCFSSDDDSDAVYVAEQLAPILAKPLNAADMSAEALTLLCDLVPSAQKSDFSAFVNQCVAFSTAKSIVFHHAFDLVNKVFQHLFPYNINIPFLYTLGAIIQSDTASAHTNLYDQVQALTNSLTQAISAMTASKHSSMATYLNDKISFDAFIEVCVFLWSAPPGPPRSAEGPSPIYVPAPGPWQITSSNTFPSTHNVFIYVLPYRSATHLVKEVFASSRDLLNDHDILSLGLLLETHRWTESLPKLLSLSLKCTSPHCKDFSDLIDLCISRWLACSLRHHLVNSCHSVLLSTWSDRFWLIMIVLTKLSFMTSAPFSNLAPLTQQTPLHFCLSILFLVLSSTFVLLTGMT